MTTKILAISSVLAVLSVFFWPQQTSSAVMFHEGTSYVIGCPAIQDKRVDMAELRRKYKVCQQNQPTIPTHYCPKNQQEASAPYWDECARDCWRGAVPNHATTDLVPC